MATTKVSPHGDEFIVPEGWEWVEVDVTCANCSATNTIHEQPPEWLDVRHPVDGHKLGVDWECTSCGFKNNIGGEAPPVPDTYVVECDECHSTFAPSQIGIADDGSWTCIVCDTVNVDEQHVHASEGGTSTTATGVTTR